MKIGVFTSGFVPVNSHSLKGTEVFTFDLCEGLTEAGIDVHLFAARGSAGNFNLINPKHSTKTAMNIDSMYENNVYQIMNFFDFLDYCDQNNIDIIHDQTTELTIGLARCSKIPLVATMHGTRAPSNLSEYYKLNRYMHFISPSKFVKEASPEIKIFKIIYHGINLKKYDFTLKHSNRLLWVGRIIPEKGLIDAIKAVEQVGEELDVIGYNPNNDLDNHYYDQALKMIKSHPKIHFLGKIDHKEIPGYMKKAKALLMPTRYGEPFGLVIIEAMACGTPVVAYNNGAINEIITNGLNGYYVPDGDFQALGRAIKKINKIKRLDCRCVVEEKFSRSLMINRYIEAYDKIITNNGNSKGN